MPSPQFIKSYFSSFTDDIISQPLQKGEKKDEDKDNEGEAAEVMERSEYFLHISFVNELRGLPGGMRGLVVYRLIMLDRYICPSGHLNLLISTYA